MIPGPGEGTLMRIGMVCPYSFDVPGGVRRRGLVTGAADAAERDSDRWGTHTGECCVFPRYQTDSAPQSWPPYVPLQAKTLSMLCGGNATC